MIVAVAAMSPTVRMLFYAVAVALFIVAAFGRDLGRVSALALGLAVFAFPAFWDALAQT